MARPSDWYKRLNPEQSHFLINYYDTQSGRELDLIWCTRDERALANQVVSATSRNYLLTVKSIKRKDCPLCKYSLRPERATGTHRQEDHALSTDCGICLLSASFGY